MAWSIDLIVGLGNPGSRYALTRHNVGFWLVDRYALARGLACRNEPRFFGDLARLEEAQDACLLLKPTTYMNRSGQAVGALVRYYRIPIDRILIVHDDLDLPPGTARLKQGGGHGGHNGLRDIIQQLGDNGFWRARIGIGHPGEAAAVVDYVLDRAPAAEEDALLAGVDAVIAHLPAILAGQFQAVMNQLHRSATTPAEIS